MNEFKILRVKMIYDQHKGPGKESNKIINVLEKDMWLTEIKDLIKCNKYQERSKRGSIRQNNRGKNK